VGAGNQCNVGGYFQLTGANQTVSHIFFDGSQATAGGDRCGVLAIYQNTGASTINDIRLLSYNSNNQSIEQYASETQFGIEQSNNVTVLNSTINEPAATDVPGYCTFHSLQSTIGNAHTLTNNYFYQGNFTPIYIDNLIYVGNVIFNQNDAFCNTQTIPGTGVAGGALGPAANSPVDSDKGSGSYHFTANNNYFAMAGMNFGFGGGINDPTTNGAFSDINLTGNWIVGGRVALDTCVYHYYDPNGGYTGNFNVHYNGCAPNDPNGGGMQLNASWQPWLNCSTASTSDPPNKDSVTPGYGFNVFSNSVVATVSAQIDAASTGITPCHDTPSTTVNHTNTVVNFKASQNYLSSSGSPGNVYVSDSNTLSPSVTGNFCAGIGTFTQTDSTTCATSGFSTPPTASFTLGTLSNGAVNFANTSFTAEYGAVKWIASTTSTTPTAGDVRWAFIPPVSLSPVTHGSTVYLWTMDGANNISAPASALLP
jgi:hypothetical protein